MQIKLEKLAYQERAIQSVVEVFKGNQRNIFDTSFFDGIYANHYTLSQTEFYKNINNILSKNKINPTAAKLQANRELTIEMETGTGKTLVYLKTIYELFKQYGLTKFIILVPSVAIRQGVLNTLKAFEKQLDYIYGFTPNYFEYSSKKLSQVTNFIEEQHPQIMVMTLASFNSKDKILNQTDREDLFANIPFIEAIGRTNPILIMDEPQNGMDTKNALLHLEKLQPLFKLRYSATHKIIKNRIYRLTPYESYEQGLVKKIEVLTVTEKNEEATLKLEWSAIQNQGSQIKVKIKAWHTNKSGKTTFKNTKWLKTTNNLGQITNNPSYLNYEIERIYKNLSTQRWTVVFTNGATIVENQQTISQKAIWELQLEWLIIRHFEKKEQLRQKGIKCLSLIFIDKVGNYIGENPIIKQLFIQKYKAIYPRFHYQEAPTNGHIKAIQGYYFAKTGKGDFTDNEKSMQKNKAVYDAILKDKVGLLSYGKERANQIEFIFSHSALGVGWDNPNIFNIATLNSSYSEIKKRQEIGRGLRICVNTKGQRVYDEGINQLTIIPNETYETFVTQYQQEIKAVYGGTDAGATIVHNHKGKQMKLEKTPKESTEVILKRFWKLLSQKKDYTLQLNEKRLVEKSMEALNQITIKDHVVEVSRRSIGEISVEGIKTNLENEQTYQQKIRFEALDVVEKLAKETGLSHQSTLAIFKQINKKQFLKNPIQFLRKATTAIKNIQLTSAIRKVSYQLADPNFPFSFDDYLKNLGKPSNQSIFDSLSIVYVGDEEWIKENTKIIGYLRLPKDYKIETSIGVFNPTMGTIVKKGDSYLVWEIKSVF